MRTYQVNNFCCVYTKLINILYNRIYLFGIYPVTVNYKVDEEVFLQKFSKAPLVSLTFILDIWVACLGSISC